MAAHPTRYADPTRCPDCRAPLDGPHCAQCGLDLSHLDATELFGYFVRADEVLDRMRARRYDAAIAPKPAASRARVHSGASATIEAEVASAPPSAEDPAGEAVRRPRGMPATSVPRILLGLGALCLLIAAVVFLALTWSLLGVGGRTAVLVAFTVAAATLAWWFEGRGLRWAAEAFATVGFGLLLLDLLGAESAGWLGDLDDGGLPAIAGAVLTLVALAATYLSGRGGPAMLAPQLVAGVAMSTLGGGLWILLDTTTAPVLLGCLLTGGLAVLGRRMGTTVLEICSWLTFALWWLALATIGISRAVENATLHGLWLEFEAWPLLAAAAFLGVGAWLTRREPVFLAALGGTAVTAVGFLVILPALTGPNRSVLVLLLAAVVLTATLVWLPAPWRSLTFVPLALALTGPAGAGVRLAATHLAHAMASLPMASAWTGRLGTAPDQGLSPLLLPLITIVTVAALASLATLRPDPRGYLRSLGPLASLAAGITVTATVAAYPVPRVVAVAVALLAAVALTFAGTALAGTATPRAADEDADPPRGDLLRSAYLLAAGILWATVGLLALPSPGLSLVTALAVAAASFGLAVRGEAPWQVALGECLVPAAAFVAVLSASRLVGLPDWWLGVAIVGVLGVLMQLRSSATWLAAHTLIGGAGALAALDNPGPDPLRIIAIMLTLAGAAYLATSVLRPDRRWLAAPGGLLLVGASWAELATRGVTTPEAYTLPAALVLVALGAWRLWADPASATGLSLGPGLALAVVPSLTAVLVDGSPVTLRGALLGIGCLLLVLGGVRLRLSAPLVVGAAAGAVLIVQFLWPYAGRVPSWALIALAGAVLTVVGVTWERRVRDVRSAGAYLAALR